MHQSSPLFSFQTLFSLLLVALGVSPESALAAGGPVISSVGKQSERLIIFANVPEGFGHVVLDAGTDLGQGLAEPLIAGGLTGAEAIVSFSVPLTGGVRFMKIRAGMETQVPASTYAGPGYISVFYPNDVPLTDEERIGHVLNRLGYGVSASGVDWVKSVGLANYVELQLHPDSIEESTNTRLQAQEAALFTVYQPAEDQGLVKAGDSWRYFKGTQAPPAAWKDFVFDDSTWLQGPSGFGYGDDDDATVLADMRQTATQPGYWTVYLRKEIQITNPVINQLILSVDYDDGFVAYLNGVEVARDNVDGTPPAFNQAAADSHEAGSAVEFDITAHKTLLRAGANVLAVQLHNAELASSDASILPALISRTFLPVPPRTRINGLNELKQLIHVRGVGTKRQLQATLAEFWDNHFTTDFDKVMAYFDGLRNSDASDAMSEDQAIAEAAQAEYDEHQFFTEHALGYFGDLLLYSATSPAMLIYLDSVLNQKGDPNENYAREILELFAFGVDNRYTQMDIEQLAKCFTGWSIRKVMPEEKQTFPASARTPPTRPSVQVQDTVFLDEGPGWRYFKGLQEPSAGPAGAATSLWTASEFNDSTWFVGATSIGFGDNDDATVLTDMRNNYVSVYLRRPFAVADPAALENLLLAVDYDDGFVAYLNGVEVARSASMRETGTPPRFNRTASASHEAGRAADYFNLKSFLHLLRPAPATNLLAIQVHNLSLDSSDLSIHPRLVVREQLPGSVENGDRNGVWTFRFNPAEHDLSAKDLFVGTPFEMHLATNRTGLDGLKDGLEVIDAMVNHPSTREFICLKLINKFVSDQITLQSYRNGTAPEGLRKLMDDALAAWVSTTPAGHIQIVLRAIFSPVGQDNYFWTGSAYRGKVKTPVEFINSTLRALNVDLRGVSLPLYNDRIGMSLFDRDMPDGWSELGFDWMDTGSLLERIKFVQRVTGKNDTSLPWDLNSLLSGLATKTPEAIVAHFNQLFFQGGLSSANRDLLVRFVSTDRNGDPLALDPARSDFNTRVQELLGLMLSAPQWHNQ